MQTDNKVTKARFANWLELFTVVSIQYVVEPVNIVSAAVTLLQGVGSGWTRHKMNMYLYIIFYGVALFQDGYKYYQQSKADDEINHEVFDAAPITTTIVVEGKEGKVRGLSPTRAERLRLGALVRIRPGQRIPINGFVVDVFQSGASAATGAGAAGAETALHAVKPSASANPLTLSPFAYAVTGEATVKPGVQAMPLRWHEILEMECGIGHSAHLTGPVLGTETSAEAGRPRLGKEGSAGSAADEAAAGSDAATGASGAIGRSSSHGVALDSKAPAGLIPHAVSSPGNAGTRQTLSQQVQDVVAGTARNLVDGIPGAELRHRTPTSATTPAATARAAASAGADAKASGLSTASALSVLSDAGSASAAPRLAASRSAPDVAALASNAPETALKRASHDGSAAPERTASGRDRPPPVVQYRVNRCMLPRGVAMLSRGMVHSPCDPSADSGARRDLFLIAGVPAQFSPTESSAQDPGDSMWEATVRTVMLWQILVVFVVSIQGWATGTVIREEEVTLWTSFAFFAGQLVMNNGLVPVRAKLAVQLWIEVCKLLYPGIRVKRDTVIETVRDVRDVVSDKTGTLTVDGMAFPAPSATPWTPGLDAAFRLLLTNDSIHNPLFQHTDPSVAYALDARLAATPALATTSEEGVIFDALTTDRADSGTASLAGGLADTHLAEVHAQPRYPAVYPPLLVPGPDAADPVTSAPSRPDAARAPLIVACGVEPRADAAKHGITAPYLESTPWDASASAGDALLAVMQYKGPFERAYVGRFGVATVFRRRRRHRGSRTGHDMPAPAPTHAEAAAAVRDELAGLAAARQCGTARGDKRLEATLAKQDWVKEGAYLVMQGGGDVVALCCGDREASSLFENDQLRENPNRTFGHAAARIGQSPRGLTGTLTRDDVVALHAACVAAGGDVGRGPRFSAPADWVPGAVVASPYRLEFLSKFENPLSKDVQAVPALLSQQGVRFHCCTGDTLLTMSAILERMGVLPPRAARVSTSTPLEVKDAIEETVGRCAVDDGASAAALRSNLMRTVEVHFGAEEAAAIASGAGSPIARVSRLLHDEGKRVVVLCSQPALLALSAQKASSHMVRSVLRHPDVVFAFYRIGHSFKPQALNLFVRQSADEADRQEDETTRLAGGVVGALPIFIGDGTNDEPALLETTHSIAIATGSLAARNASNIEVHSAAALPDVISMSRLNHGGRLLVLRDVLFVGGLLVALLAVSAHLVKFTPMAEGTLVIIQDPWSPFMTLLYTILVHTPRMLTIAVTDGMQPAYRNHRFLAMTALVETAFAMGSALWVGLMLAPDETLRGDSQAMKEFAIMAVAAVALIVYLRQNLLISDELQLRPRLLPPQWAESVDGLPKPHTESMRSVRHRYLPIAIWALNGVVGQLTLFCIFCSLISRNDMPTFTVVIKVFQACAAPALLLAAFRLVLLAAKSH